MIRKIFFSFVLCVLLVGCGTTNSNVYSLVYYIPQTEDEYYETSSFAIGTAPFSYEEEESPSDVEISDEFSPLDAFSYVEDSDYEPISMVSPEYDGTFNVNPDEGVGFVWNGATVFLDDAGEKVVSATCVYSSEYAYFYVDNEVEYNLEEFIDLGTSFDRSYEIVRSVFGNEADVDGNGHVRFLITEFDEDTMGFYYPLDQYSNEELRKADIDYLSNESDVLYINSLIFEDKNAFDITDVYSTLAHEFSHMAYFDHRERNELPSENSMWIVEGLAMWAEFLVGLPVGHDGYISDYLSYADEIGLFEEERGEIYGYGLLFFRYFEEVFGRESIIALVNSPYIGTDAISDVTGKPFDLIFEDFVMSLLATATYADEDYYLPGLNNIDNGFILSDEVEYVISDKDSYYNLEGGYSYYTDFFYPFSLSFFISDGGKAPDFESDRASLIYVESDKSGKD